MANTRTTTNMGMVLPLVGIEVGPTWATEQDTAMDQIDAHDHSSGKGVKVTPAGLNISADLAFASNRASGLHSSQYASLTVAATGTLDLGSLQNVAGNLWWVNTSGTGVQITSGGSLNSSALVSNLYAQQAVSTNLVLNPASSYVEMLVDTSAARTLTLPAANGVTAGRFYIFKDVTGSAGTNAVTINRAGTDTFTGGGSATSATIDIDGGAVMVVSDGTSKWDLVRYDLSKVRVQGTAPTTGNGLYASSASVLAWGALNLAGGSAYVSGILPSANLFQATTSTSGAVKLATDLDGTAAAPTVQAITGTGGVATVRCGGLRWPSGVIPLLDQTAQASANTAGSKMGFVAQTGNGVGAGGIALMATGVGGATGLKGAMELRLGGAAGDLMVHMDELDAGRRAIGLFGTVTAAKAGTGDLVAYMNATSTVPTTAPASSGVLIYNHAGALAIWGSAAAGPFEIVGTTSGTVGAVNKYLDVIHDGTALKIALFNP